MPRVICHVPQALSGAGAVGNNSTGSGGGGNASTNGTLSDFDAAVVAREYLAWVATLLVLRSTGSSVRVKPQQQQSACQRLNPTQGASGNGCPWSPPLP